MACFLEEMLHEKRAQRTAKEFQKMVFIQLMEDFWGE